MIDSWFTEELPTRILFLLHAAYISKKLDESMQKNNIHQENFFWRFSFWYSNHTGLHLFVFIWIFGWVLIHKNIFLSVNKCINSFFMHTIMHFCLHMLVCSYICAFMNTSLYEFAHILVSHLINLQIYIQAYAPFCVQKFFCIFCACMFAPKHLVFFST